MSRLRSRIRTICAAAALAALSTSAHAATRSWTNTAGGAFNAATNWFPAFVPTSIDRALFDNSASPYTVTFATNVNNDQLVIGRDDVTFDLLTRQYSILNTAALPTVPGVVVGELSFDT